MHYSTSASYRRGSRNGVIADSETLGSAALSAGNFAFHGFRGRINRAEGNCVAVSSPSRGEESPYGCRAG